LNASAAGDYQVFAKWTQHANRATNAQYTVYHSSGESPVTVNQRQSGGQWNLLGTFALDNTSRVEITDQANGYVIADAVMAVPVGAAPNTATWIPNLPANGNYRVYAKWTAHANRATNATYTVVHASGSTPVTANQQTNGGQWNLLGTFAFTAGAGSRIELTDQANGYVIADAIKLVAEGAGPNRASWPLNPPAAGQYQVFAKWTQHPNRATDAKYTVHHTGGETTVTVNQQQSGGQWNLLGTFNLDGNSRVALTDQANGYVIADAVRLVGSPSGGGTLKTQYLHTDHLGTPRLATNATGQVIWRWDGNAFGNTAPNEDPDNDGTLTTINLRMAGQFADGESGLFYNWNRYYDPRTGRYITSDPMSVAEHFMRWHAGLGKLAQGLPEVNSYTYVNNNPLRFVDPFGLEQGNNRQRGYPDPKISFPFSWPPPKSCAGCGTAWNENVVPDVYLEACNRHDKCYGTPGRSKLSCDWDFFKDAFAESGPSPNIIGPFIYFLGPLLGGGDAYRDAQNQAR